MCFFEKAGMHQVPFPKSMHLKMNLSIHINTTEFMENRKTEKYGTSTKLNKNLRMQSLLSKTKFDVGVAKETKEVPDQCKSFLKHRNHTAHPLIKDTKRFECTSTVYSYRLPRPTVKNCGELIESSNGNPWNAPEGKVKSSRISIAFYRTLLIARIDIEQLDSEWFNKIYLKFDDGYKQVVMLTNRTTTQVWSSIKIDPPSCTTKVHISPLITKNDQPMNNKPTKYGIKKIRFYGARVHAPCKMVQAWSITSWGKYKAMECEDKEICIQSSGKCIQGCQHSNQCKDNEYCNVNTYQCHRGELKCGNLLKQSSTRIVNGEESVPHSRPWMVFVRSGSGLCGGTLISDTHVLTAAHCKPAAGYVVLGEHDRRKYDVGEIKLKVKKYHQHPLTWLSLDETLSAYDIAILTLEQPVRFSSTILPACLPNQPSKKYVNRSSTAVGWGVTFGKEDGYRLREVDLTIIPMRECQKAPWLIKEDQKINMSKDFHIINETHALCAGRYKETKGSYNYTGIQSGDSGGPLIVKDPKTGLNTVIGVSALAPGKTYYDKGPYFVFAEVEKVLPWILDIING